MDGDEVEPPEGPTETTHRKVRFCLQCEKNTSHRYANRSWVCTECQKDEWL